MNLPETTPMAFRFSRIALVLPLALVVACSAATEPTVEDAEATQESLQKGGVTPRPLPPKHLPPLPLPPKPEPEQPSYEHACTVETWAYLPAQDEALRVSLGCDPAIRYFNGASAGWLGGIGALCPNTPALRAHFHGGFGPDYCDDCLHAPPGKVYVFFSGFMGPNCPSGCRLGVGPGPI